MFHLASIIVNVAITRPYIFLIQVLNNFSDPWPNFEEENSPVSKRIFEEHPYVFLVCQKLP